MNDDKRSELYDRIKQYEYKTEYKLEQKQPVIIRLDGKAFKTYTKNLDKPFDMDFSKAMEYVAYKLKEKIDNVRFIYSQSDELNLLLADWTNDNTQSWFQYRIQKVVSTSSALASVLFNEYIEKLSDKYYRVAQGLENDDSRKVNYLKRCNLWKSKKYKASFDSRAFNLPREEVCNYFTLRQQDAERNSKQSLAHAYFSHNELMNKTCDDMLYMLQKSYGIDYYALPSRQQRGFALYKNEDGNWIVDDELKIFGENPEFIDKWLQ